jgi:hypothetical protein
MNIAIIITKNALNEYGYRCAKLNASMRNPSGYVESAGGVRICPPFIPIALFF